MKVKEMSKEHLVNRIAFFERKLAEKPEAYYMGESEYAEAAVDQENAYNNQMAESIQNHIKYMKQVLKDKNV